MRFELTAEQAAWREEVRAFLREHLTPEVEAELAEGGSEGRGPLAREFIRKLGARGWWGVAWPKELGGLGRSACEQYIFIEELEYAFAPSLHLTVTSVAPTILRVGSEAQKREWIPRILRGEVDFAIGYSEPEAGTDLASLQTRAVEDGDTWVIDGQKIWNTGAAHATHEWLACRTEPAAPRHRGISLFIVPLDAPGITIQSLATGGGFPTYQVFFDGVRVPRANLIGERGRGWEYMTMALDFERVAMGSVGGPRRLLDDLVACCRATVIGGRPLADDPVVRAALAELDMEVEAARLLGWLNAWTVDQGRVPVREASMVKVASSEVRQKVCDVGLRLLGLYGLVGEGPCAARGRRRLPGGALARARRGWLARLRASPRAWRARGGPGRPRPSLRRMRSGARARAAACHGERRLASRRGRTHRGAPGARPRHAGGRARRHRARGRRRPRAARDDARGRAARRREALRGRGGGGGPLRRGGARRRGPCPRARAALGRDFGRARARLDGRAARDSALCGGGRGGARRGPRGRAPPRGSARTRAGAARRRAPGWLCARRRAHRRVREGARAVRPADRGLPGRAAPVRGHGDRARGEPGARSRGRLAARARACRGARGRDRARLDRAPLHRRHARRAPAPRRHGLRHRVPAAPLLEPGPSRRGAARHVRGAPRAHRAGARAVRRDGQPRRYGASPAAARRSATRSVRSHVKYGPSGTRPKCP